MSNHEILEREEMKAKRWTPEEESRVTSTFSAEYIAAEGMAELIGRVRNIDKNSRARGARRDAHIARHGQASANCWY
jgi:hypothetical protein